MASPIADLHLRHATGHVDGDPVRICVKIAVGQGGSHEFARCTKTLKLSGQAAHFSLSITGRVVGDETSQLHFAVGSERDGSVEMMETGSRKCRRIPNVVQPRGSEQSLAVQIGNPSRDVRSEAGDTAGVRPALRLPRQQAPRPLCRRPRANHTSTIAITAESPVVARCAGRS